MKPNHARAHTFSHTLHKHTHAQISLTIEMHGLPDDAVGDVSDAHLAHVVHLGVERAAAHVHVGVPHRNLVTSDLDRVVLDPEARAEVSGDLGGNDGARGSCEKSGRLELHQEE